jgi:hypothetical protein
MLSVVMLSVTILSMLSVIMLNAVMLSVIGLNVDAPARNINAIKISKLIAQLSLTATDSDEFRKLFYECRLRS